MPATAKMVMAAATRLELSQMRMLNMYTHIDTLQSDWNIYQRRQRERKRKKKRADHLLTWQIVSFSFFKFALKRIFNEYAWRDGQYWCQVLQCHINHLHSVGYSPATKSVNTFSNIRLSSLPFSRSCCPSSAMSCMYVRTCGSTDQTRRMRHNEESNGDVSSHLLHTASSPHPFSFALCGQFDARWIEIIRERERREREKHTVQLVFYRHFSVCNSDEHKW